MQEQSSAGRQRGAAGERMGGINASLCSPAVPLAPDSHPGQDDVGHLHLLPACFPGRPVQRSRLSPSRPSLLLTPTAPTCPTTSQLQVSGHPLGSGEGLLQADPGEIFLLNSSPPVTCSPPWGPCGKSKQLLLCNQENLTFRALLK